MILLVHSVFGAGIGWEIYRLTGNLPLALLVALLSHYFLDCFPHIEYLNSVEAPLEQMRNGNFRKAKGDMAKVAVDFAAGCLLIIIFSNRFPLAEAFGMVAIIPDGLTVLYGLTRARFLSLHQHWHERIQYLTKRRDFSKGIRIATQVAALIVGIALLVPK